MELAKYDVIICQQNYNLANTRDFRKYKHKWLGFLEKGGILLVMEVQGNPEQLDWIADLGPRFHLKVRSFSGFQHESAWTNAESELDFGFVKATWGHFAQCAPQWVVTNRNVHEKPIIAYQRVGKGLLLASTTYRPYFPKEKHLEI